MSSRIGLNISHYTDARKRADMEAIEAAVNRLTTAVAAVSTAGAGANSPNVTEVQGFTTNIEKAVNPAFREIGIDSDVGVVINRLGRDRDTRIKGDNDPCLVFCDAGNDRVGIGTCTPTVKLDVVGGLAVSGAVAIGGGLSITGDLDVTGYVYSDDRLIIEELDHILLPTKGFIALDGIETANGSGQYWGTPPFDEVAIYYYNGLGTFKGIQTRVSKGVNEKAYHSVNYIGGTGAYSSINSYLGGAGGCYFFGDLSADTGTYGLKLGGEVLDMSPRTANTAVDVTLSPSGSGLATINHTPATTAQLTLNVDDGLKIVNDAGTGNPLVDVQQSYTGSTLTRTLLRVSSAATGGNTLPFQVNPIGITGETQAATINPSHQRIFDFTTWPDVTSGTDVSGTYSGAGATIPRTWKVAIDAVNPWTFAWSDVGTIGTPTASGQAASRTGTLMDHGMSWAFDGTILAKAALFDASRGVIHADFTTEVNDAVANDVNLFDTTDTGGGGSPPAAGDYFIFGSAGVFGALWYDQAGGTQGVGGTVVWEYYSENGGAPAWIALSNLKATPAGANVFNIATGNDRYVAWDIPAQGTGVSQWSKSTLLTFGPYYWIRVRIIASHTTHPIINQMEIWGPPLGSRFQFTTQPARNECYYDSTVDQTFIKIENTGLQGAAMTWNTEAPVLTAGTIEPYVFMVNDVVVDSFGGSAFITSPLTLNDDTGTDAYMDISSGINTGRITFQEVTDDFLFSKPITTTELTLTSVTPLFLTDTSGTTTIKNSNIWLNIETQAAFFGSQWTATGTSTSVNFLGNSLSTLFWFAGGQGSVSTTQGDLVLSAADSGGVADLSFWAEGHIYINEGTPGPGTADIHLLDDTGAAMLRTVAGTSIINLNSPTDCLEQTAPSAPAANTLRLFNSNVTGELSVIDSGSIVTSLMGGGVDPVPFATEVDDVGAGVTYIGEAAAGTATSAALWRIKKMTETGPDISIIWADGDTNQDNIWDNRASLSYS